MNVKRLLPLAAAGIALAAPAVASADTYCVHQGGSCPAGTHDYGANLTGALDDSWAHFGDDAVTIGPGTYTATSNPFQMRSNPAATNGLTVVGSGAGTVLERPSGGPVVSSSADISAFAVTTPAIGGSSGLQQTGADAGHITVTGGANNTNGVMLYGNAVLHDSVITMDPATTAYAVYAAPTGGMGPTIRDAQLSGRFAVYANGNGTGAPMTISRVRGTGVYGVFANQSELHVDTSQFVSPGGGSFILGAACAPGHDASLALDGVTVIGPVASGTAIDNECDQGGGHSDVTMRNTVISGTSTMLRTYVANGGQAPIDIAYSAYDPAKTQGPGIVAGAGIVTAQNLGFAGASDYRPLAGSPLVDAGDPAAAGLSVDLNGLTRISGGRIDIGAYEYQQPVVVQAGGGGGGGGGSPADPGPAVSDAPSETAAPATTPAPVSAPVVDVAALLRQAIASGQGRSYTFTWPQAGTVRFSWVRHGRTIASGRATRTTPGPATVALKGAKHRPAKARIRGVFTPQGGTPVRVSVALPRR